MLLVQTVAGCITVFSLISLRILWPMVTDGFYKPMFAFIHFKAIENDCNTKLEYDVPKQNIS